MTPYLIKQPQMYKITMRSKYNSQYISPYRYLDFTMATSDQCALGPDGGLLDASEIHWVHDPDDPMPIAPAVMAAGSRRSTRVSQPSKRVLDPNNAKHSTVMPKRLRPSHQNNVVESESDSSHHLLILSSSSPISKRPIWLFMDACFCTLSSRGIACQFKFKSTR